MTKQDDIPPYARRIKQLREELNLTQKALGKLVGVTDAAITFWELGQRTPRGNNLKKLVRALGVTESDLYKDTAKHIPEKPAESSNAELLTRLYRVAPTLQNDELELLLLQIEAFTSVSAASADKISGLKK